MRKERSSATPPRRVRPTTRRVTLPPSCLLANVGEVGELLRGGLAPGSGMVVDAAAVEIADITLVQLLLAAQRSTAAQGRTFELDCGDTAVVARLLETAGITIASLGGSLRP